MATRSPSIVPAEGEARVANVGYGAKKYEPKVLSPEPRKSIVPRKSIAPTIRSLSDMSDINLISVKPEPEPERKPSFVPERRMSVFPARKSISVDKKPPNKCAEACAKASCAKTPMKLPQWCLQKDYGGIVNILWFTLGVGTLISANTIFGLVIAKVVWQQNANINTYQAPFGLAPGYACNDSSACVNNAQCILASTVTNTRYFKKI